jgi:hypothetical protein
MGLDLIVNVPVLDPDGNLVGRARVKVADITIDSFETLQELEPPEYPQGRYSDDVRKYFEDKKEN